MAGRKAVTPVIAGALLILCGCRGEDVSPAKPMIAATPATESATGGEPQDRHSDLRTKKPSKPTDLIYSISNPGDGYVLHLDTSKQYTLKVSFRRHPNVFFHATLWGTEGGNNIIGGPKHKAWFQAKQNANQDIEVNHTSNIVKVEHPSKNSIIITFAVDGFDDGFELFAQALPEPFSIFDGSPTLKSLTPQPNADGAHIRFSWLYKDDTAVTAELTGPSS